MKQKELRLALVTRFPRERQYLLPALHYIHDEFGHLPDHALQVVAWHLHVPASEVYGAATSYTELRLEEPPERVIRVCTGLSCLLNGARDLVEAIRATNDSNSAVVEERSCAFLCAVAPVVEINQRLHGLAQGETGWPAIPFSQNDDQETQCQR